MRDEEDGVILALLDGADLGGTEVTTVEPGHGAELAADGSVLRLCAFCWSVSAPVVQAPYALDLRVLKEVGKLGFRLGAALRLLQLLPRSQDDQDDACDGFRAYGSRMDDCGVTELAF
jgi:hypothetical protein